jgi:hypothetical protein
VPGFSLVSASGPVIATGPDADGTVTLRFEPPLGERSDVNVALSLLAPRDPKETAFEPVVPAISLGKDDRVERVLTVVAEGGLLVEPEQEEDWTPRTDLSDVRSASDDVVLGWRSRVEQPKPPRLAVRRLKSLAVASALARVELEVFVGVSGETRTRLVADVRSRGRSSLRFRVPADATLLAVRSDGQPAVASRPSPERVEVPVGGDAGRVRVELLLSRTGPWPIPGDKLTLPAPAPEEPIERVSWTLVLPPGIAVKEEGRRVPAPPEPPASPPSTADPTPGERAAFDAAQRFASADREASREGAWSPRTFLPPAPLAYATDVVDVGESVPPLVVTLVAPKEENSWY